MPNQSVIVLDFGGQYNQLIARRVRECNVYCEVKPHTMSVDEIRAFDPIGIIFTGGPQSVYAEGSPQVDPEIFRLGIPILGAIPDDEEIVISTNQGEPLVGMNSFAGQAYLNICKRILGQEVPLMGLEKNKGFFHMFSGLLKRA